MFRNKEKDKFYRIDCQDGVCSVIFLDKLLDLVVKEKELILTYITGGTKKITFENKEDALKSFDNIWNLLSKS